MKNLLIANIIFLSIYAEASVSIDIEISSQRLFLKKDGQIIRSFPISSSSFGEGQTESSLKTPYGKHKIKSKIGTNVDKNDFFVSRDHIPQAATIIHEPIDSKDDYITSRIMWLEGEEEGFNKGGSVDSFRRYIYIHGTHEEGLVGQKASHGCIRMFNHDVIELFDLVSVDTSVDIL